MGVSPEQVVTYQAPVIWNQLPVSVHHSTAVSYFKSSLKTFLFLKTFLQSHSVIALICDWCACARMRVQVCVRACVSVCIHVVCIEF